MMPGPMQRAPSGEKPLFVSHFTRRTNVQIRNPISYGVRSCLLSLDAVRIYNFDVIRMLGLCDQG